MNKSGKLLKIAGVINLLIGLFLFKLTMSLGSAYIILGFFLFAISNEEEKIISKYKILLLIIGIILIPLNLITAIFILIAVDSLPKINGKNAPPIKQKDSEAKKIDILLKLGVGMVFVSGILFATTSWDIISDLLKALVLILLGILFLGLSLFTEKKLKLYKSTYMYWILSMAFFLLTIVGILYFGIFGNYLTYNGLGSSLAYTITYLTVAGLAIATYLKFPKKYLLYLIYGTITLALYNLLRYINLSYILITLILSIIILMINIFSKKESHLFRYSKLLSYLIIVLLIYSFDTASDLTSVLVGLVNVLNLYYLIAINDEDEMNILNVIITYIIMFAVVYTMEYLKDYANVIMVSVLSINAIVFKLNMLKTKENMANYNFILYSFSTIIIYLISSFQDLNITFTIAILYLLVSYISSLKETPAIDVKYAEYFIPVAILGVLVQVALIPAIKEIYDLSIAFIVTTIVYCFIHMYINNENKKEIYYFAIIIELLITMIINLFNLDKMVALLILIPSIYLFYLNWINKKEGKTYKILTYILFLFSFYNLLVLVNIFNISGIISNTILLILLLGIIILIKEKNIKTTTYFAVVVPLFNLIGELELYNNIKSIFESICILYITFLAVKFICKESNSKNIIGIIGILISLFTIFFIHDLVIGIYIGIIGLIVLAIGYKNKEYNSLFYLGLIITIINIIYQLEEFWEKVPFWLYLLIGGLAIIGFVTYKESKKLK